MAMGDTLSPGDLGYTLWDIRQFPNGEDWLEAIMVLLETTLNAKCSE